MSTPDNDSDGQIRPFAAVLQEIDHGEAHQRASDLLNQLVQAVADTGKKGVLTVQVTVAPYKKGTRNLDVTVKSSLKAPDIGDDGHSAIFFHASGNLRRDDPTQPTLPVRGLDTARSTA